VILGVAAVGVLVLKTVLQGVLTRFVYQFLAQQQAMVSANLAQQFLSRPLMFVQQWTTSEATYALGGGVSAATVALLGATITILAEVSLFVVVLITLLIVDPWVTLASLAIFTAVIAVTYRYLSRRTARNAQVVTDGSIDTLSAVSEALQTYREAFVLDRRKHYADRYSGIIGGVARASASNTFIMEVPKFVLESTLYVAILALGMVQFLINQSIVAAAGTIAIFLAAGMRVVPAMLRLQGATITVRNASVAAQPTFYMVDRLSERGPENTENTSSQLLQVHSPDHPSMPPENNFEPDLIVRAVTYTYPGASSPAIRDISFTAAQGTSVALVGSTGAGKSTLADIILGVIEPDSGTVEVSGIAPGNALTRWPGMIGYVPQSAALVPGTVRQNVALGLVHEQIDDDLIWEALERARIAGFLRDSREGLDTSIGERGIRLSGGQRQRLGIARALYSRPKLLVLDEATSSLDAETEAAIVQTLDDLEGEVTTITVAHRLATVRRADQLLYLEGGCVRSTGTFAEVRSVVPDFDRQASLLGL
jgi:ABC-type multidrug transport system fused ATPase/permease subunit